jgi:CheY-like chemotaxis protein
MDGLPICYVKSTVLCIDDNIPVTTALAGLLGKQYPIVCFNKTNDLISYLQDYKSIFSQNKLLREFNESEYGDLPTSSLVQFNLKNIKDLIDDPNSINEISVILVDNAMPDMNGLVLCEKLKDYSFQKLLYTGTGDYKSGLDAMNMNIIGNFIDKDVSPEILAEKIEEFSFRYFYDKTFILKQHLEIDGILPLSDKLFVNYFKQLLKDKNIIKYCLIDKNGSILMKDNSGNSFILIVHTDKSIEQFLKLIFNEQDFNEIYDIVYKKQKIPYVDYSKLTIDLKSTKLFVPDILIGKENYYIHFLEE